MTNKSIRDYINLIENAQKEQVNEFAPDGFDGGSFEPFDPEMAQYFYEQGRIKGNSVPDGVDVNFVLKISHIEDQYKKFWLKGWHKGREEKKAFWDKEQGVAEEQVEESTPDAMAKIDELFRD